MKKNQRLEELTEKYKENALTQSEFLEFIQLLNSPGNLQDMENIVTDHWHRMSPDQHKPAISKKITYPSIKEKPGNAGKWKMAASFVVFITTLTFYFLSQFPKEPYTNYHTDFAEILEVELPDGSLVTLNANSELSWNNQWEKNGIRQVILNGEAFFKVKNLNSKMAFLVEAGEVSVEVVGTSFNVDKRNQKVEVYLDEGKVNLRVDQDSTKIITMEPGQKIKIDAEQKKIEKTANESMISSASWKKGVLNFKDMEFREVLGKLKYIYGKSFQCEDENLLSKKIYLGVPYSDWEAVRQALELSLDIHLTEAENTITITSN